MDTKGIINRMAAEMKYVAVVPYTVQSIMDEFMSTCKLENVLKFKLEKLLIKPGFKLFDIYFHIFSVQEQYF